MVTEELERICFNCNFYFPDCAEITEYGICLDDEDFAPYIDDLLEDLNFASCQELIDKKKFMGDREVCEKFEAVEIIEIDDDSILYEKLPYYNETGEIDQEELERAKFEERLKKTDWENIPVGQHVEKLESGSSEKQKEAVLSLGRLIAMNNRAAFEKLFGHLEMLPPPETIAEVHLKKMILENLLYKLNPDRETRLISLLIGELYKVASNNTTNQWITSILKYLARAPQDIVREPLEALLVERKFSYKTRKKIEAVLDQLGQEY